MLEDELFESVKRKRRENKISKVKAKVFVVLTVFIMLAGTAAAGTLLQNVNAPGVSIQATTSGGMSGNFEITLGSYPSTLNFNETQTVIFNIHNDYDQAVLVKGGSEWVDAYTITGASPPYTLTVDDNPVLWYIIQTGYYGIAIKNGSTVIYENSLQHFQNTGVILPANFTGTLEVRMRMPTEEISYHKVNGSAQTGNYTMATGDQLRLNAKIVVESI